jgi:hypothetical protein
LFRIISTLFDNMRDILFVYKLASLVIRCTSITLGRICVHKRLDYFLALPSPLMFGGFILLVSNQIVNNYTGVR